MNNEGQKGFRFAVLQNNISSYSIIPYEFIRRFYEL